MMFVLQSFPFPPCIVTDCLSILTTMQAGSNVATHHPRILACIWTAIQVALEMSFEQFLRDGLLVWMPAHQNTITIGERKKSDESRVSAVDWRAIRLVDMLANTGARRLQADETTWKIVEAATLA